jgi:hypothetical protein
MPVVCAVGAANGKKAALTSPCSGFQSAASPMRCWYQKQGSKPIATAVTGIGPSASICVDLALNGWPSMVSELTSTHHTTSNGLSAVSGSWARAGRYRTARNTRSGLTS